MNTKYKVRVVMAMLTIASLALVFAFGQKVFNPKRIAEPVIAATDETEENIGIPTGDDPFEQVNNLLSVYNGKNGVAYTGQVKLIDDNGDKEKVMEEHVFSCSYFKGNSEYAIDSTIFINAQGRAVVVDLRNKIISLAATPGKVAESQLFDITRFKQLLEEKKANASVTQTDKEKLLTIDSIQDPQIQGYRIYYDPVTFNINKIMIGMVRLYSLDGEESEGSKSAAEAKESESDEEDISTYTYYLEISNIKTRAISLVEGHYDPAMKYLDIKGQMVSLRPAFSHFQLINLTGPDEEDSNQQPTYEE